MKSVLSCITALILAAATASAQQPAPKDGFVTTRDGVKLYYQIYGTSGDTIVHLHGGPGGSLIGQLPNLVALSARHVLISYDQRGGGKSVPVDTLTITAAMHVSDLEDLRRELKIPRMTLYGHSWGVALALLYTADHPDHVRQLVLNGPMPPAKNPYDAQRWQGIADAVTKLCEQRADAAGRPRAEYVKECRSIPRINSRVYYHDTLNIARSRGGQAGDAITPHGQIAGRRTLTSISDWDFRPLMQKVKARALIVEGEHTPVPLDQIRLWAATMPNARLLLVPKTGHPYPHIENPDYFFPALEEFLSGGWPSAATVERKSDS